MRWKGKVAYDGTDFNGWQSQADGNTVQDFLERRLSAVFKRSVRIHGSGRTDSGVHAKGQVFHFDGDWPHPADWLLRACRSGIPSAIQVSSLRKVPATFHARFSAKGKRYVYHFFEGFAPPFETRYFWSLGNRRLDLDAMRIAARPLLGKHDFSAFAAARGDGSRENPVKDLRRLEIRKRGPRVRLIAEGSGYLYKMARSLAGALADVGFGKLTPETLETILQSRRRTALVQTAPACGLLLDKVFY